MLQLYTVQYNNYIYFDICLRFHLSHIIKLLLFLNTYFNWVLGYFGKSNMLQIPSYSI